MGSWRIGLSLTGLMLSFCFCIPLLSSMNYDSMREYVNGNEEEAKDLISQTQAHIWAQTTILLLNIGIGIINYIFSLCRSNIGTCLTMFIIVLLVPFTIIQTSASSYPVFDELCCCDGNACIAVNYMNTTTCSIDTDCSYSGLIGYDYTLYWIGSCLMLVCLIFLLATTCSWRKAFREKEKEWTFFNDRRRRLSQDDGFTASMLPGGEYESSNGRIAVIQ